MTTEHNEPLTPGYRGVAAYGIIGLLRVRAVGVFFHAPD